MRLDDYRARSLSPIDPQREDTLVSLLQNQAVGTNGRAFILDRTGKLIVSSAPDGDPVVQSAVAALAGTLIQGEFVSLVLPGGLLAWSEDDHSRCEACEGIEGIFPFHPAIDSCAGPSPYRHLLQKNPSMPSHPSQHGGIGRQARHCATAPTGASHPLQDSRRPIRLRYSGFCAGEGRAAHTSPLTVPPPS